MIDTLAIVLPLMLSPGPANLVSFVLGARDGPVHILPFQCGIIAVYGVVALALGMLTTQINAVIPEVTLVLQILGGLFIIYLGVRLARRTNRENPEQAPTFANGALLQCLNPKYPGVVLAVFVSCQGQSTLMVASVIVFVGVIGLLAYSTAGSLFRRRAMTDSGFRVLDLTAGILLCLVGIWFILQPLMQLATRS